MIRFFALILCAVISVGALTSCKKKTAAEETAQEVAALKEVKRTNAIKYFKQLAKEYPNSPHAAEATARAAKLEAAKK